MFDSLWDELRDSLLESTRDFRSRINTLAVEEKPDRTLLTEADTATEQAMMEIIRRFDKSATFLAEESAESGNTVGTVSASRVWVIDPIDGTAEFVRGDRREFCHVACLIQDGIPTDAFVLAPELGPGRSPITVTTTGEVGTLRVNGLVVEASNALDGPRWASLTRSRGTSPRPIESTLNELGYQLKIETTSQTVDMVRTVLDLSPLSDLPLPRFGLFVREQQKVWDGVAGLSFGRAAGLVCVDLAGTSRLPVTDDILTRREPKFESTVMGAPEVIEWLFPDHPTTRSAVPS